MRFRLHGTALQSALLGTFLTLQTVASDAQPPAASRTLEAVRSYRNENVGQILDELVALLEIPNVASDAVNIRRNAQYLVGMLEARGIAAQLLQTPGSPPAVYGELSAPGAKRTILLASPNVVSTSMGLPTLNTWPAASGVFSIAWMASTKSET